jgi:hypothetical protein
MKQIVYRVWLLSRDERLLRTLCFACVGLATLSYLLAGLQAVTPPDKVASYEPIQFTSAKRFVSP